MQRPALLLSQGKIYLAFGSYTERKPFYGWVVSYDAATLEQHDVFVSTPEGVTFSNGGNGGIWQSGQGLAASPNGHVYFFTGNGVGYKNSPWANAAVELAADLSMVSVFRPYNAGSLDLLDLDLSCSGAMLVPETKFVLGGGKEGRLYVMNQGNLGTASKTANDVVSEDFIVTPAPECVLETGDAQSNLHGAPVYWKSVSGAANLYLMGEGDFLHKLEIDRKIGKISIRARSKERAACGMPGGFLSVSSNGDKPRTAIVWANVPAGDSAAAIVPATFYAYDAETLETLYRDDSRSLPGSADQFAKFVPPTVANGRVYQAAFAPAARESGSLNADYAGSVVVYGLKSKLAYK
jgi:hypothetical protein